jgi:Ca2+-binding RTX toxin-like protein
MRIRFAALLTLIAALSLATAAFADTITGDDADNRLRGTNGADLIDALGGSDRVNARKGDDVVNGGEGNDRLRGSKGDDVLNGDDDDDTLKGGKGVDQMHGGPGDDRIDGRGDGRKADTITCGDGFDVVKADHNDVVPVDGTCEDVHRSGSARGGHRSGGRGYSQGRKARMKRSGPRV